FAPILQSPSPREKHDTESSTWATNIAAYFFGIDWTEGVMRKNYTTILVALAAALATADAGANVVISQVYGGGNNASATYQNDFIELFNNGTSAVSLNGWSVQYASSTGTSWTNTTALPNVNLQPGQYFLIQESGGTTNGAPLPTPDVPGGGINMS